jgi:O-acetylserine/cysteine efflux transporter
VTPASLSVGDLVRVLVVVVIWGLNFVVMKFGLQSLSPMLLGALRYVAASVPFLLFVRRPALPWRYLVVYGLAQGVGQFGLLFLGLKLGMTAGMASVVMQTQAFFTLIMAVAFFREPARRTQWLGLGIAFGGLLLIALSRGEGAQQMTLAGFVLTLGAAFMWAVSNMVVRQAVKAGRYEPFAFIVWSSLVPILPFIALSAWLDGPKALLAQLGAFDGRALLAVLYLALLATLLAYSLWTRLLQTHPAGRVTPFSLMVPVVGLLAAMALLGEQPAPGQWAGTAAVLCGMLINQLGGRWLRGWR